MLYYLNTFFHSINYKDIKGFKMGKLNSYHQLCCLACYTRRIIVRYSISLHAAVDKWMLLAALEFPCCLLISKLWVDGKYQGEKVAATQRAWVVLVREVPCSLLLRLLMCQMPFHQAVRCPIRRRWGYSWRRAVTRYSRLILCASILWLISC